MAIYSSRFCHLLCCFLEMYPWVKVQQDGCCCSHHGDRRCLGLTEIDSTTCISKATIYGITFQICFFFLTLVYFIIFIWLKIGCIVKIEFNERHAASLICIKYSWYPRVHNVMRTMWTNTTVKSVQLNKYVKN